MSLAVCCPRCGGAVRPPDLMHSDWRCDRCGAVPPLHLASSISADVIASVVRRAAPPGRRDSLPLWCPWPLLPGWTVTGVAWAGDERTGARATALALAGPAPLAAGPADVVIVAEDPGVGLGNSLGGIPGTDPGPALRDVVGQADTPLADSSHSDAQHARVQQAEVPHAEVPHAEVPHGKVPHGKVPHAKVKAAGHPTPLWAVPSGSGGSAYVGEARGVWLFVLTWPAHAGYLLAEEIHLQDLVDSVPAGLVFGAPTTRLRPVPREE